jgi:gas vesicle protein
MAYRTQSNRVETLAGEAVESFGTDVLIDRVVPAVEDSHKVNTIATLVQSAEAVDTRAFSEQTTEKAGDVAEEMGEEIHNVVDEVVADECAQVLEEAGPEWWEQSDILTEEMVSEAVREAAAWLQDHPDAAERVGVPVPSDTPEPGTAVTHDPSYSSDKATESNGY